MSFSLAHIRSVVACAALVAMVGEATSHDWFTPRVDPVTNERCCGGGDCSSIPAEWFDNGSIIETADGYAINLTLKQAQRINFSVMRPIKDFVPWARVQMSSDDGLLPEKVANTRKSGFSMCIWANQVKCFFKPPGNS